MSEKYGTHDMLIVCSFRYCLGRGSYMVWRFVSFLQDHWDELLPTTHKIIHKEIKEALDEERLDDWSNAPLWMKILELKVDV